VEFAILGDLKFPYPWPPAQQNVFCAMIVVVMCCLLLDQMQDNVAVELLFLA
jgi:hypothetical protein